MLKTLQEKLGSSVLLASPTRAAGLIVGVAVALQLVAVTLYNDMARPIFELGFQYEPYLQALYEGKGYIGCEDFGCNRASRMPAIPYFLLALTALTLKYKVAAYLKVVLLGIITFYSARALARELKAPTPLAFALMGLIIGFVVFAPNLVKHMSVLHYEEGYLIALIASVVMLVMALLLRGPARFSAPMAGAAVALAAVSYLVKSSQVAVLLGVVLVLVPLALSAGRRGVAAGLVALALLAPAGWATHNALMTGRASFMSSYDGENFFRGFNANTLRVYPRCGTDVLFSGSDTCMGEKMGLPKETSRFGFADEWAWNDAYKARAFDFIREQPALALRTLGTKFLIVTAWPRLVPYVMEETSGKERYRKPAEEALGAAWLIAGRIIELFGLGLAGWLLLRGDGRARAVAASSLLLAAGYGAPYVFGFAMERHFSIFILICALSTLVLVSEWQRMKKGQTPSRRI